MLRKIGLKQEAEAHYDRNESDDSKVKILVARNTKSRVCAAIPVSRKGADQENWNLKESVGFLEFLGIRTLC